MSKVTTSTTHDLCIERSDEERDLSAKVDSDDTVQFTVGDAVVPGWFNRADLLNLRALITRALSLIE